MNMSANAILKVDLNESNGRVARPIDASKERLMALSVSENIWYGFIIEDKEKRIDPGIHTCVRIRFLDEIGSKENLKAGCSILFGDGSSSRGILIIEDFFVEAEPDRDRTKQDHQPHAL